jgi:hypothetical protein
VKVASIICGILAGVGFVSATSTVFLGKNRPDDLGDMAGYVVGAYLFPTLFLIASVWFWQRSQKPPAPKPPA